MISLFGLRIPFFRTGNAFLIGACLRASQAANIHQEDTKRNCTTVKVTGFGSAVRMALDDVLERIEVAYQTPQRITSFGETGALSASAISCAFWLTLAFLVLTVRMASLKLFCLPCLGPLLIPPLTHALPFCPEPRLACHRSFECNVVKTGRGPGLGDLSRSEMACSS